MNAEDPTLSHEKESTQQMCSSEIATQQRTVNNPSHDNQEQLEIHEMNVAPDQPSLLAYDYARQDPEEQVGFQAQYVLEWESPLSLYLMEEIDIFNVWNLRLSFSFPPFLIFL